MAHEAASIDPRFAGAFPLRVRTTASCGPAEPGDPPEWAESRSSCCVALMEVQMALGLGLEGAPAGALSPMRAAQMAQRMRQRLGIAMALAPGGGLLLPRASFSPYPFGEVDSAVLLKDVDGRGPGLVMDVCWGHGFQVYSKEGLRLAAEADQAKVDKLMEALASFVHWEEEPSPIGRIEHPELIRRRCHERMARFHAKAEAKAIQEAASQASSEASARMPRL